MQLTAAQKKTVRSLHSRRGREKHSLCICEGMRACRELIAAAPELITFAVRDETTPLPQELHSIEFASAPQKEFQKLSSTVTPQGMIVIAKIPEPNRSPPDAPFIPVLDQISDPGNMGTIIRTLNAAGLKHLWLTKGSTDPFGEKTIRAAMAAQFKINIRSFDTLQDICCELRKFNFNTIFRTDCHAGKSIFQADGLFEKSAIVFGSEAAGATPIQSAIPVNIPMPGKSESINVAQAFTVCIFEAVRRGILNGQPET